MNIDFNRNEDVMKIALSNVKRLVATIEEGGGKKAIEKQKEKNKLNCKRTHCIICLMIKNLLLKSVHLPVMACMKNMADALQAELLQALAM